MNYHEKNQLLRLVSRTAQDYPLGGNIETDCFKLPANTVAPAIQQLAEQVCTDQTRISNLEEAFGDLTINNIVKVGSTFMRIVDYTAQGPTGTAAPHRPAWRQDPVPMLLFWDGDAAPSGFWRSTHVFNIGFGRNATNTSGYIRVAGGSQFTVTGVGMYPPWTYNCYAVSGSCDNDTTVGPTNCELYFWTNGINSWVYQWPNYSRRCSGSFSRAYMMGWTTDFRIQIAAFAGPTVYLDYPRVITYHELTLNDGVTP